MAKYFTTEHIHPYPWDQVAAAVFQRYPNPFATHVLSEDTVHREIIDDSVLYTRRVLTKTNKVPGWGERFISGLARRVPLVEESYVDSKARTITLYTRSIGYSNFMVAVEKITFQECPSQPHASTVALKQGWVESNFYGLRSAIKNFGIERFKKNIIKSTDGFNHVLERLAAQQQHLRDVAGVRLAEFSARREQLSQGMEHMREVGLERVEHMKEVGLERVEQLRDALRRVERVRGVALEQARLRAEMAVNRVKVHAEEPRESEQQE